jgi:hypothetical protein
LLKIFISPMHPIGTAQTGQTVSVSVEDDIDSANPQHSIPKGPSSELTVELPSGKTLPDKGGFVDIPGTPTFRYFSFSGNKIRGLSNDVVLAYDPSNPEKTPAELTPIAKIQSTGTFPGSGFFNVDRTVTYWWPMGTGVGPGEDDVGETWGLENEWDMEDWYSHESFNLGIYDIAEVDGSDALYLDEMNPSSPSMPSTMTMFQGQKIETADYMVQIKIKLSEELNEQRWSTRGGGHYAYLNETPPHYVAGISFRKMTDEVGPGSEDVKSYGVSFVRGKVSTGSHSLVPSALIPGNNAVFIVLWRYDQNSNTPGTVTRLAYAPITSNTMINSDGLIREWSTLLMRIQQIGENDEIAFNRIIAMYGHHDGPDDGNDNAFDQLRNASTRDGVILDDNATLPWPPKNIADWSAEKDYFTVVEWNIETGGGASVPSEGSRYYVDTAPGENLFEFEGNLEIGLHTWGNNMAAEQNVTTSETQTGNPQVWFDDLGIYSLATTGGDNPYVSPIQQ